MKSFLRARHLGPVLGTACASSAGLAPPEPSDAQPPHDARAARPDAPRGRREQCNGLDDDLDGRTDEGCPIRLTRDPRQDAWPTLSGRRVAWVRFDQLNVGDEGDLMIRELPDGP